jgi:hypothetical protein
MCRRQVAVVRKAGLVADPVAGLPGRRTSGGGSPAELIPRRGAPAPSLPRRQDGGKQARERRVQAPLESRIARAETAGCRECRRRLLPLAGGAAVQRGKQLHLEIVRPAPRRLLDQRVRLDALSRPRQVESEELVRSCGAWRERFSHGGGGGSGVRFPIPLALRQGLPYTLPVEVVGEEKEARRVE